MNQSIIRTSMKTGTAGKSVDNYELRKNLDLENGNVYSGN